MVKASTKILTLVIASLFIAQISAEAVTPQPRAPRIARVEVLSPTRAVITYTTDLKNKKLISKIQFSKDGGATWKTAPRSPISISTTPETRYDFRMRQTSKTGKVLSVGRVFSTGPVLQDFNVQQLLWSDEFNSGTTLSTTKWTARYCGTSASNGGGTCYNNESQYFLPSAIRLESGAAVIHTDRINSRPATGTCLGATCAFTSGRFDTQGKVSFQYGYIEARIKMPAGEGNWPAFWMMGTDITSVGWPVSGEMDIAEQGGQLPIRNSSALHYSTTPTGCCDNHEYDMGEIYHNQPLSADFHTYGLAWTEDSMTLLFDRIAFWTISADRIRSEYWPGNKPYFLIFDNAIGPQSGGFGGMWGDWTSSTMQIDYVRSYKIDGEGSVSTNQ